jgi:hypothetical protein
MLIWLSLRLASMSVRNYIVVVCIMMPCSVITLSQSFGETFSFQLQIIKWSQYVASKCVSDYMTLYLKDQNKYTLFLSNIDVMVDLSFCYSWKHVNSGCTALLSHNLCSNWKWVNSVSCWPLYSLLHHCHPLHLKYQAGWIL